MSKQAVATPAPGLPDRPAPGVPLIPRPGAVDPMPAAPPSVVLELNGQQHPLTARVTVLGRSPDVEIPLDDPGVSRRHAEIRLAEGIPRIVDLGSTNGTFVDGERVQSGVLRDGSVITMGRSRLLVRYGPR
jgi:pSer/pThr/pTyr-binding forkhead associated (FHA) protein